MANYEKITLDGVMGSLRRLAPGMPFNANNECYLWLVLDREEPSDERWYILSSERYWHPRVSIGSLVFGEALLQIDEETDREELDTALLEETAMKMIYDLYRKVDPSNLLGLLRKLKESKDNG